MLRFYKQQSYFSQIVSKKANITISFFMKNSKNNNIILDFSFMYLVSVYPTNRTFSWKTNATGRVLLYSPYGSPEKQGSESEWLINQLWI